MNSEKNTVEENNYLKNIKMKINKNGKTINLTESDLKRIVKRVLTEEGGDDPDTESKASSLGGGLSMFKGVSDVMKSKVGKRRKEMVPLIKSTDDLLMSLIDFHDKYQEKETIKSYFQKFKTKARDEYDNFYRNPDLTKFQNPWGGNSVIGNLRIEIIKLYQDDNGYMKNRVGNLLGDCIKDVNRSMSGLMDGKDIESLPISHEWGDGRLNTFIAENPPIKKGKESPIKG